MGLPQSMLGYCHPPPEGGTPCQGDPPDRHTPPPGLHPRGKLRGIRSRPTPRGEIEGDQNPPPPWPAGIWSMSGRYASYWNAFLFMDMKVSLFLPVMVKRNPNSAIHKATGRAVPSFATGALLIIMCPGSSN